MNLSMPELNQALVGNLSYFLLKILARGLVPTLFVLSQFYVALLRLRNNSSEFQPRAFISDGLEFHDQSEVTKRAPFLCTCSICLVMEWLLTGFQMGDA